MLQSASTAPATLVAPPACVDPHKYQVLHTATAYITPPTKVPLVVFRWWWEKLLCYAHISDTTFPDVVWSDLVAGGKDEFWKTMEYA